MKNTVIIFLSDLCTKAGILFFDILRFLTNIIVEFKTDYGRASKNSLKSVLSVIFYHFFINLLKLILALIVLIITLYLIKMLTQTLLFLFDYIFNFIASTLTNKNIITSILFILQVFLSYPIISFFWDKGFSDILWVNKVQKVYLFLIKSSIWVLLFIVIFYIFVNTLYYFYNFDLIEFVFNWITVNLLFLKGLANKSVVDPFLLERSINNAFINFDLFTINCLLDDGVSTNSPGLFQSISYSGLLNKYSLISVSKDEKNYNFSVDFINNNQLLDALTDYFNNYNYWLSSLTLEQQGLMMNVSVSFTALLLTSSLITIFYSDWLVVKFNIEKKFPSLGKFFVLRRKFQSYYFFINSLLIVALLSIALFLNLYGLFSSFSRS